MNEEQKQELKKKVLELINNYHLLHIHNSLSQWK